MKPYNMVMRATYFDLFRMLRKVSRAKEEGYDGLRTVAAHHRRHIGLDTTKELITRDVSPKTFNVDESETSYRMQVKFVLLGEVLDPSWPLKETLQTYRSTWWIERYQP